MIFAPHKPRSLALALTLCIINTGSLPVWAGSFSVIRPAREAPYLVHGEAAAPKIGNIIDSNFTVSFDGERLSIFKTGKGGVKEPYFGGLAFNVHLYKEAENEVRIRGFCYFDSGPKLDELIGEDKTLDDILTTLDGRPLEGQIQSISDTDITFVQKFITRTIPLSQIKAVVSSRVYTFSGMLFTPQGVPIDTTNSNNVQAKIVRVELDQTRDDFMTVVGRKRLEAAISAKEYTKKQKAMLIGASIFLTAAAIAIPAAIALPLTARNKNKNRDNQDNTPADDTPVIDEIVEIQK